MVKIVVWVPGDEMRRGGYRAQQAVRTNRKHILLYTDIRHKITQSW